MFNYFDSTVCHPRQRKPKKYKMQLLAVKIQINPSLMNNVQMVKSYNDALKRGTK